MRLHRLQLNAFGPFAGTEEVDFDHLSEAGLFLLHGQTGAGKTSVLDAVCYALYGRVPGARGAVRPHLRSDHADDAARPEVRLELTLDGRRFEITRSPEWQRPKKRGVGTTPDKGSVALRERTASGWQTLTTRADEAGHLLQDLIGMRLDQFTKVVLLPQGEFAAFLRSDAEQRRGLLEQLFATGRYSDVETWLSERRRAVGREVADVRSRTEELLARADEHAAQLTGLAPEGDGAAEVSEPAADESGVPDSAGARVVALAAHAARRAEAAAEQAEAASATADQAAAALAAGRELTARRARLATLTAQAGELMAAEPDHELRRARLAEARRAAPLGPHLATTARLRAELERATDAVQLARAAVPAALVTAGRLALETTSGDHAQELGRLAEAVEADQARVELQAAHDEAMALGAAAERSAQAARAEAAQADERRTAARSQLERIRAEAARRPSAEAALQDLERTRRAVAARADLLAEVKVAQASVARLHDTALAVKEHWLALREERLAGMAAELATGLSDGAPCPVCGSGEHPNPATAQVDPVSGEAEADAQLAAFDAEQALASARENLAALQAGVQDATERAGDRTAKQVKAAIAAAKADLAVTDEAADRLEQLRADLPALDGQIVELALLAEGFTADAAGHRATAKATAAQVRRLTTKLDQLRGGDADLTARRQRLEAERAAIGRLLKAMDDLAHLTATAEVAVAECESAYAAAGFATLAAAAEALLPDAEMTALAQQVTAHDDLVTAVRAQLEDPDLLAAADLVAPDLARLTEAEAEAAAARRTAEQSHARLESARVALQRLAGELTEHERRSEAVLKESRLVDDLARCVEGTGGDNVLRMRLSSYVLAARLEEVAAAATERLLVMSDGRYSLVHTDALAKGGVRSGLGLRVVDGWTGVERDTATLSGGESFLASLALALGLADAVQAEAGGAVMQTLFIDEGFGMLDDETLDEVMTVLDGLREGGRSVGLVSHVADLRNRIATQLEVRKSRNGSRIVIQETGAA